MDASPVFTYHALAPLDDLPWDADGLGDGDFQPSLIQPEISSRLVERVTEKVRIGTTEEEVVKSVETTAEDEFIALDLEGAEAPQDGVSGSGRQRDAEAGDYVPPPWVRSSTRRVRSPLLRLHQEIVDFCNFLAPTPEEKEGRDAALKRVSDVVLSIWPHSKPCVFGSFATGLFLPTSDVDVVVLGSGVQPQQGLKALSTALSRRRMAKKMQVIAKARVPIVKFVEIESGLSFDISFDVANGPQAAEFIKKSMEALPPLRPLCLIVKIFLQQRELNEVYTGGVGSYALIIMLMAHLQLHPSRRSYASNGRKAPLDPNLGVLLVDFLELYGKHLFARDVGVSCRNGGAFYSKRQRGMVNNERPWMLSVEDPQQPDNDIGKNSYNVQKVRAAFLHAHHLLTSVSPEGVPPNGGLLERIVRLDTVLTERKMPSPPLLDMPVESLVKRKDRRERAIETPPRKANSEDRKSARKAARRDEKRRLKEASEEGEIEEYEVEVEASAQRSRSRQKKREAEELYSHTHHKRRKQKLE